MRTNNYFKSTVDNHLKCEICGLSHRRLCTQSNGQETSSKIFSTCISLTSFFGDIKSYKIILARGSGGH